MKRRAPPDRKPPGAEPRAEPKVAAIFGWRRWVLALVIVAIAILLFVARWWPRVGRAPHEPNLVNAASLTGLDPIVKSELETAVRTVRAKPRSGQSWGQLAMLLHAQELASEAIEAYAYAARLEPAEARWPYLQATLLRHQDLAAAIKLLSNSRPAKNELFSLRLGEALLEAGRLEEAENAFRETLQRQPDSPAARIGLAELQRARGQFESARSLLSPALASPFTQKRATLLLAMLERELGNPAAAEKAARRALQLPPDRTAPDPWLDEVARYRVGRKAWAERAQELLNQGRQAEAGPLIDRLLEAYPHAPEGWFLKGRLEFDGNNCAQAERPLRRHLELAPLSVNGQSQLGIVLLCQERYREAIPPLEKAIELKPDFAEAHYNLGFAQARSGLATEAIASFRRAIRFSPNFVDPHITAADLLAQTGDKAEARQLVLRALELSPEDERAKELWRRLQ